MLDRPSPFLIAEHRALDFLNSVASPKGVPIEWLRDGRDLVDWLQHTNQIGPDVATRFRQSKDQRTLDRVAERAREFRNWLRAFVTGHMGKPLNKGSAKELGPLNQLLAGDTSYTVVEAVRGEPVLRLGRVRRWEDPDELLLPIAVAAADLVCSVDFRVIRACELPPCTLMFLDRTKAGIRRWCSMAVCGNRAKAAAHRAKKRRG
jgi:predicted RNA-binding Zn ribbon-like protein